MYSPTKLVDSFVVSGLPYYDAPLVFDQLKLGSDLTIVPERDNPYDPEALALYSTNNKLGFIPKESNSLWSTLLFYGHQNIITCKITQLSDHHGHLLVKAGLYVIDARSLVHLNLFVLACYN